VGIFVTLSSWWDDVVLNSFVPSKCRNNFFHVGNTCATGCNKAEHKHDVFVHLAKPIKLIPCIILIV